MSYVVIKGELEYIHATVADGYLELRVCEEEWDALSPKEQLALLESEGIIKSDTLLNIYEIGDVVKIEKM